MTCVIRPLMTLDELLDTHTRCAGYALARHCHLLFVRGLCFYYFIRHTHTETHTEGKERDETLGHTSKLLDHQTADCLFC